MPEQEPKILTTAAGDRIILATQGGGRDHQRPDRRELRGLRARRQLVRERQDHPGTVLRPRGMSHAVESRAGVRRHPNHQGLAACRCRPVVQGPNGTGRRDRRHRLDRPDGADPPGPRLDLHRHATPLAARGLRPTGCRHVRLNPDDEKDY